MDDPLINSLLSFLELLLRFIIVDLLLKAL